MTRRRAIELDLQLEIREYLARMEQSVRAAVKGATRMGDAFEGVQSSLTTLAGAAGLAFGASELLAYAGAVNEARTEIINLSKATGISTSTLGAFELAAGRSGVEVSEILGGFEDFGEVLFDFTQGGGRAEEALRMLGFTSAELAGRLDDVDGVALELIEQMRGIEDAGLRNAVAQQLFGDAGNRLNAILGDAPLDEWIAAAGELGVTVDDNATRATERWNEATAILSETIGKTGGNLLAFAQEAIAPLVVHFARGFEMIRAVVSETFTVIGERVQNFVGIVTALYEGDLDRALGEASELLTRQVTDWGRVGMAAIDAAVAFDTTQASVSGMTGSIQRGSTALASLAESTDAAKTSQQDHAALLKEQAKRADELAAAHEALGDIASQAAADQLGPIGEVLAARDEQLERIRELEATTGETAQSRAAAEAVVARAVRDQQAAIQRIEEEAHRDRLDRLDAEQAQREQVLRQHLEVVDVIAMTSGMALDALGVLATGQLDQIRDLAAATRAELDETESRIAEIQETLRGETQTTEDQLAATRAELARLDEARSAATDERVRAELAREREQLEATERRLTSTLELELGHLEQVRAAQARDLAEQNKRLAAQFEARKVLEIAGITVSGAAAAIAALAPPPVGAGPIVGAVMAAGIAASTGAAIADVSRQQPPQFHAGYAGVTDAPDEIPVRLTRPETVNNARATEALGGPAGVAELNATGQLPAPRGRTLSASELGRALGRLLVDEFAAGRELSRAFRRGPRMGVRPVFGRR